MFQNLLINQWIELPSKIYYIAHENYRGEDCNNRTSGVEME